MGVRAAKRGGCFPARLFLTEATAGISGRTAHVCSNIWQRNVWGQGGVGSGTGEFKTCQARGNAQVTLCTHQDSPHHMSNLFSAAAVASVCPPCPLPPPPSSTSRCVRGDIRERGGPGSTDASAGGDSFRLRRPLLLPHRAHLTPCARMPMHAPITFPGWPAAERHCGFSLTFRNSPAVLHT